MSSPRPSNRESPAKSRRLRLALLGGALFVVILAGCWAVSWWTRTGVLGFGVALGAALTVATGAICLRELRRLARAVRRVDGEVRRTRQDTAAALSRLDRVAGEAGAAQRTTRSGVRSLGRLVSGQRTSLETILAAQLETNRALSVGLDRDTLQGQLASQLRQQQALLNLFALVPVRDVVPPMGGWAASADVVSLLIGDLLRIRPRLVVECGSGVSTLWTALAIEHYGLDCRVVSLDHDTHFAEQTRRSLRAHGVDRYAEVRDAPLVPTELDGHSTGWYDRAALVGLNGIGLLFVDGPPGGTGPLARYPAVPLLKAQLALTATIVLDDLIRPGEREVVARWRLQLPDFEVQLLPLQKSAAVFRRVATPALD